MRSDMPRTYCLIDIQALRNNLKAVRSLIGASKLMFVVKADAYGHGAEETAKAASDLVDLFGVATADEGAKLRESGIRLPIVILGNTVPCDYHKLIEYGLAATVFSQESARLLDMFAVSRGTSVDIHIAIDTGMGRIGFVQGQEDTVERIYKSKGLKLVGAFTHFACADDGDGRYTQIQTERLEKFLSALDKRGITLPIIHAANSAAILCGGDRYDAVRAGIIAYGLYPSDSVEFPLSPVLSWRTGVIHLKTLEKGERVSYGGEFVARRRSVIATLPVGYADGYPRALSGKAYVLIRGKRALVAGRICMDQFMVDVTDIEDVRLYDEAVLIGSMGEESITAEELAKIAGTINYEIVCRIGKRVPRIYCDRSMDE